MIARLALVAPALIALAAPVAAQSTFERMETVSEALGVLMNDAFVAQIPALEGAMPDPEWDDAMRDVYRCVYDGYIDAAGEEAVEAMVTEMEEMVETVDPITLIEGTAPIDQPEGITDEQGIEIVSGCGLMEVFMARMAESGALGILMQNQ